MLSGIASDEGNEGSKLQGAQIRTSVHVLTVQNQAGAPVNAEGQFLTRMEALKDLPSR